MLFQRSNSLPSISDLGGPRSLAFIVYLPLASWKRGSMIGDNGNSPEAVVTFFFSGSTWKGGHSKYRENSFSWRLFGSCCFPVLCSTWFSPVDEGFDLRNLIGKRDSSVRSSESGCFSGSCLGWFSFLDESFDLRNLTWTRGFSVCLSASCCFAVSGSAGCFSFEIVDMGILSLKRGV